MKSISGQLNQESRMPYLIKDLGDIKYNGLGFPVEFRRFVRTMADINKETGNRCVEKWKFF